MKMMLKPDDVARVIVSRFSGSPIPPDTYAEDARDDVFRAVIQHIQTLGFRDTDRWENAFDLGYAICPSGALLLDFGTDNIQFSIEPDEKTMLILISHEPLA